MLIVYTNKNFVLHCILMSSHRHQKGRTGAKINVIELQRCYFVGKSEYYRGCRKMTGGVNTRMHVYLGGSELWGGVHA